MKCQQPVLQGRSRVSSLRPLCGLLRRPTVDVQPGLGLGGSTEHTYAYASDVGRRSVSAVMDGDEL